MDMESKPFWQTKLSLYPSLKHDLECDVAIIGAGIAGLSTAFMLTLSGKNVVIIDDGMVAGGQTKRTTGHLSSLLNDRYYNLEKCFGTNGIKIATKAHLSAIDFIQNLVSKYNIDCDFQSLDGYLFNPPKEDVSVLEKEYKSAKKLELDVSWAKRSLFQDFDTGPALCFGNQAQFHPLKYVNALSDLIIKQNGRIFCGTHIDRIEKKTDYILTTGQSHRIKAPHVVVATNSPTNNRFFPHLKQAAYRTYAVAGMPHWPCGYLYFWWPLNSDTFIA